MENIIQAVPQYLSTAILVIGLLAFGVSIIVQVIKSLPLLNKIPTNAVVFVLAIILSVVALFVYAQIMAIVVYWYYVVAAVILGFFVAYIAIFGWTQFNELYKRFVRKDE
jgi:hypothetical protein